MTAPDPSPETSSSLAPPDQLTPASTGQSAPPESAPPDQPAPAATAPDPPVPPDQPAPAAAAPDPPAPPDQPASLTPTPAITEPKEEIEISQSELRSRLCLNSSSLVEEIHATLLRQLQSEDLRESRLDAKAQGLLGTAGLSLTLAFTFGNILLGHPEYFRAAGSMVPILFALALLAGMLSSAFAVAALLVRAAYGTLTDGDIFNKDYLAEIDEKPNDEKAIANKTSQRLYRRFIMIQNWKMFHLHFKVHERKAKHIKYSQICFLAFLFSLTLIGGAVTSSAYSRIKTSPSLTDKGTPP